MDHPSEVPHLLPCLFTPRVALAEVTVVGVIAAILQWQPQPSLKVWLLIGLIILIGIVTVVGLVKEAFHLRMAKHLLAFRLEEGQALFDKAHTRHGPPLTQEEILAWNDLTEQNLRQYVDELHVARFRYAGYREGPDSFTTFRLEQKLKFLDGVLEQLKG